MTTRTPVTVAVIALAIVVFTGCVPEAPAPPETAPVTETTAPAAPSETTAPSDPAVETPAGVEALPENAKAGDVIDAETAAQLNERSYMGSSVPLGYQMPNGEYVLIMPGEPLPEPVAEAEKAEYPQFFEVPPTRSTELWDALQKQIAETKAQTGRTVIFTFYDPNASATPNGPLGSWGTSLGVAFTTREEAVAHLENYASSAPEAYLIVVAE